MEKAGEPAVLLDIRKYFPQSPQRMVEIDKPMVDVILHLWKNGVMTYGSAWGEEGEDPYIVFEQGLTNIQATRIRRIIKVIDPNTFYRLKSWRLVDL